MLVLSRKTGQCVDITGGIRVNVLEISGNRVKIGIDAPDSVRVLRTELRVEELTVDIQEEQSDGSQDNN